MRPELVDTVPSSVPDSDAPLPTTYGRFVALGVIGHGGMGVVLRAKDPDLDRPVALKLLGPDAWGTTESTIGEQRLEREAQALAKLAHPNIVTIYEMGRVGEHRFIAMELVEGMTLRAWMGESRSRTEILDVFIACGRGLSAAHAAGLVHRDFKPENVLIDREGRPRVVDFGLVASGIVVDGEATDRGPATGTGERISVHGAIVGTPAYMAPEQWRGIDVDARTDQFAFCVALWEALYGQRPFPGTHAAELRGNVVAGTQRDPVRTKNHSRAIERVLRRGLARDREERWPSLDTLLTALEAIRSRSRAAWIGGALLVVAGGIAGAALLRGGDGDRCVATELEAAWNASVTERVAASFLATGLPYARAQATRVIAALDAYAARWASLSEAACRSPRSPELDDKRAICLDRGRIAMERLVESFATAGRTVVERSPDAIASLPDLAGCASLEMLDATTPLPTTPAARARLAAIAQQLAEANVLRTSGEHRRSLVVSRAALADARSLGHPSTLAAALQSLGDSLLDAREVAAAEATYREAASVAADARDDLAAATAWTNVLFAAAERREKLEGAAALDPVAEAAVRRAGDPPHLRYAYLRASGVLASRTDDFETARARFSAATAIAVDDPVRLAEATTNLARIVAQIDGGEKALDVAARAVQLTEQAHGPDHPATSTALVMQGEILSSAEREVDARRVLERARSIRERVFGHDSVPVVHTLQVLGRVSIDLKDTPSARAYYDDVIAIESRIGTTEMDRAMTIAGIAVAISQSAAPAESLPYFDRALDLLARSSTTSLDHATLSAMQAQTLRSLGRCPETLAIIERIEDTLAKYPRHHANILMLAAQCARVSKDPAAAIPSLERAIALCASGSCQPMVTISLRWELGQALVEAKRDHARAISLVSEARTAIAGRDPTHPLVAEADAWLAVQRR